MRGLYRTNQQTNIQTPSSGNHPVANNFTFSNCEDFVCTVDKLVAPLINFPSAGCTESVENRDCASARPDLWRTCTLHSRGQRLQETVLSMRQCRGRWNLPKLCTYGWHFPGCTFCHHVKRKWRVFDIYTMKELYMGYVNGHQRPTTQMIETSWILPIHIYISTVDRLGPFLSRCMATHLSFQGLTASCSSRFFQMRGRSSKNRMWFLVRKGGELLNRRAGYTHLDISLKLYYTRRFFPYRED